MISHLLLCCMLKCDEFSSPKGQQFIDVFVEIRNIDFKNRCGKSSRNFWQIIHGFAISVPVLILHIFGSFYCKPEKFWEKLILIQANIACRQQMTTTKVFQKFHICHILIQPLLITRSSITLVIMNFFIDYSNIDYWIEGLLLALLISE